MLKKKQRINEKGNAKIILVRTVNGRLSHVDNLPEGYSWKSVEKDTDKWEMIWMVTKLMKEYQTLTGAPRNRVIEILCSYCSCWDFKKKSLPSIAMFMHGEMYEAELENYLYSRFTKQEMVNYILDVLVLMKHKYPQDHFSKALRAYQKGKAELPSYKLFIDFIALSL